MQTIKTTNKTRLGANYNEKTLCVDFKLYSKNATHAILCIFENATGENPVMNFEMKKNQDNIFETSVKSYALWHLKRPIYYGYRLFGSNFKYEKNFEAGSAAGYIDLIDGNANRFNPNKIAYDPYSKELSHIPADIEWARVNFSNYRKDNAKIAIKSVFRMDEEIEIEKVAPRAFKNEIIGEVHLKDLTALADFKEKGTYLGALNFARAIKDMGFTMIEFLPLHEFDSNGNYWGYMPLSYFALTKNYLFDKNSSPLSEFRKMVKAFHELDIKVCMDVVYNHTGEGLIYNNDFRDANLMSYALIDNSTYYKTTFDNFYTNISGCKNDFNIANPAVQNLIADSIEFFAKNGVDAFRFDLATALMETNEKDEPIYDKNSFATKIKDILHSREINVNSINEAKEGINFIAEPWTCCGQCAYQLGNFPPFYAEWNDIARNTIRANTARTNSTDPLGLRNLIEGTPFLYGDDTRSINYITSHDGFTLNDLNSYDFKSPKTKDGSDNEICSSYGGDIKMQENAMKKQLALLMLSKGVPMLSVGDIVAHSKEGNNNSYNLDNKINYIDFAALNKPSSRAKRIFDYTSALIKFRKNHKIITDENYNKSLEFYSPNGTIVPYNNSGYWQNAYSNFFAFKTVGNDVFYMATSKADYEMEITLPQNTAGKKWYFVTDSAKNEFNIKGTEYNKQTYALSARALVIFAER